MSVTNVTPVPPGRYTGFVVRATSVYIDNLPYRYIALRCGEETLPFRIGPSHVAASLIEIGDKVTVLLDEHCDVTKVETDFEKRPRGVWHME